MKTVYPLTTTMFWQLMHLGTQCYIYVCKLGLKIFRHFAKLDDGLVHYTF